LYWISECTEGPEFETPSLSLSSAYTELFQKHQSEGEDVSGRNFLVIMVDELTLEGIGAYGGIGQTPVIDRLANRGTRFETAYTPSPVCVPARASFQTGLYAYQSGNWSNAQAYTGAQKGWAHRMKAAGHETVSIGKLHYRAAGEDHGFAREIVPLYVKDGQGWVFGILRRQDHTSYDPSGFANGVKIGDDPYTDYDRTVRDRAVHWLTKEAPSDSDKPWALFVSFLRPHYPLTCPEPFYQLYDPDRLPPIRYSGFKTEFRNPVLNANRTYNNYDDFFTDDRHRNEARACYFGLCSFVDSLIGDVLGALESSGHMDDTVILFTSDHGEMNGHHGLWTKMTMYEEATRIPMILSGPGIPVGVRSTQCSLIDIHQTALTVTGLGLSENDHALHGRSLEHLATKPDDPNRIVLSEYHDGGAITGYLMIRDGRWKYICYPGFAAQLFDLEKDPHEANDLGLSNQHADIRTRLHAKLTETFEDPEAISDRAFEHQRQRIEELGGFDGIYSGQNFDHTPVEFIEEARPN
jgi:choline-sulfatase